MTTSMQMKGNKTISRLNAIKANQQHVEDDLHIHIHIQHVEHIEEAPQGLPLVICDSDKVSV